LASLLSAHIPLIRALDTLKNSSASSLLKLILTQLQHDIETGCSIADALRRHPQYFNPLVCNLVAIGEQSSTLTQVLQQIALEQERWSMLKQQIKNDLAYPLTLLCLTTLVSSGLLLTVVPQFAEFFQQFNAPLPYLTQCILGLSHALHYALPITALVSLVGAMALRHAYHHTPAMTLAVDQRLLNLTGIGLIIQCILMARLTATLSTALHAGLPLTDALQASTGIITNQCLRQALINVHTKVTQGVSLSMALKQSPLFPHRLVQLITIGEESGKLEPLLNQLNSYYNQEITRLMRQLSQWLEPCLMTLLGGLIGTVIIGMYLPIFQLGAIV
jgi:type IV pilus assembly protein PilC